MSNEKAGSSAVACERDSDGIWEDTELSVEAQGGAGEDLRGLEDPRDGADRAEMGLSQTQRDTGKSKAILWAAMSHLEPRGRPRPGLGLPTDWG